MVQFEQYFAYRWVLIIRTEFKIFENVGATQVLALWTLEWTCHTAYSMNDGYKNKGHAYSFKLNCI